MTRLLYLLGMSLAVIALPVTASAQNVTLEPGLYNFTNSFSLGGREMPANAQTYCVLNGENTITLEELVANLSEGGHCSLSNVTMTSSTGRADLTCTDTGLGLDVTGTLDAKFGPDFYDVETQATLGQIIQLQANTSVRRQGDCPEKADAPDDLNPK